MRIAEIHSFRMQKICSEIQLLILHGHIGTATILFRFMLTIKALYHQIDRAVHTTTIYYHSNNPSSTILKHTTVTKQEYGEARPNPRPRPISPYTSDL